MLQRRLGMLLIAVVALSRGEVQAHAKCAPDSVAVGQVCVDRYEESVWSIPAANEGLLSRIRKGRVTLSELQSVGATQVSVMPQGTCVEVAVNYPATFPPSGNWTAPLYAISLPGVLPTTCTTWFQAEQACRLAGKRIISNQEWQAAAAGTPDPGAADDGTTTCATNSTFAALTGARSACVSSWGAHDMVGNAWEWTSQWGDLGPDCTTWDDTMGTDMSCVGGNQPGLTGGGTPPAAAPAAHRRALPARRRPDVRRAGYRRVESIQLGPYLPSAWIRGGNFGIGTRAGVFTVYAGAPPATQSRSIGFRCVRDQ